MLDRYPVSPLSRHMSSAESEEDHEDLTDAVRLVKEVIAAVDNKVNEHEKRRRLKDFHGRMDSKSIMMTKSGQIFAKEDLLRRRLIHDGMLQLKNCQGRPKGEEAANSARKRTFTLCTYPTTFLPALLQTSTLCCCRTSSSSSKRKTRNMSSPCW